MTTSMAEHDLRQSELRVTRQRIAILDLVRRHPHSDADFLVTAARQEIGRVSTQAVYDVLHALTDAGLVRRVVPAGSSARYDPRVGDNHHHVVCRDCGAVRDVDCAIGTAPCLDANCTHGFLIDEAEVTYWGLCPDCQRG